MAQQGPIGDKEGPGSRLYFLAGTFPKPSLWAIPGSVIPWGSSVSLWCQGSLETQGYSLKREGRSRFLEQPNLHGNKAKFSIPSMTRDDAGRYRCFYSSRAGWSEPSEALELVVTGVYSKPSLSALPSPVVKSGANVTLQCATGQQCHRFILTKEGEANLSWNLESRRLPNGQFHALFPVGPVILGPKWSFRCYSYDKESPLVWSIPSDPLELLVSVPHAQGPSPHKELWEPQIHTLSSQLHSRWTFRCYGYYRRSPQVWSIPSDPLELPVPVLSLLKVSLIL
ncbi:leukocyte immunoglobulin-like receptor subfamily A member 6 [Cavia porcellus]|uniref:leukocyte immunoglobulin-like receptor subfamily A member 6 n=1 Tax=Cavia porcellus TaxID=10141 RepID=UPI000661B0D8|nr:leukocyte immunoglobulin-like receptor subfamily A member 6 [Cavia porcellus]